MKRDHPIAHTFLESDIHGELIAGPPFVALVRFFDNELRRLAGRLGAIEQRFPSMLRKARLEKLGFYEAFPHHATPLASPPAQADLVLSPAICYHLYDVLEGQRLSASPLLVTSCGVCFRSEGKSLDASRARLWSFSMREIVIVGADTDVSRSLTTLERRVKRFFTGIGLRVEIEAAADSFFLGEARGRAILQRLAKLKSEFRYTMQSGSPIALGSTNSHRDFFGKRMKIVLQDGSKAHTGCVAFGLERLALAFLDRYGSDAAAWPPRIARRI